MCSDKSDSKPIPSGKTGLFAAAASAAPIAIAINSVGEFEYLYPYVFAVTLATSLVLGSVAFVLLRERQRFSEAVWAGFVVGAILPAIFGLHMAFVAPFEYISIVGSFGLAGMAGAALMWLLLSLALFHQRIGAAIMTLLFGAGVAWNWIVPDRYVDSTCHNVIPQGETSISARESLEFEVAMQDWRELEAIAKDFADDHGLSFRSDVRPSYDFPWFQLSMCNSDGTVIDINRIGIENGLMSLAVYQSNDDVNWRPLTREFAVGVNSSGILQQQLKPESLE